MSETEPQTDEPRGRTYYDVLGVPPSADRDSVRIAYRTRLVELQPDAWQGNEGERRAEAARVNDAWNTLSDPFQRDRYDALVEEGAAPRLPDAPDNATSARTPRRAGPQSGPEFVVGSGPVPAGTTAILANRINALFFDIMLSFAGFVAFLFIASSIIGPQPKGTAVRVPWLIPATVAVTVVLLVLVFVVPTARRGQTVGQKWFGVRVVRAHDGQLPGLTRTLYRYGPLIVLVAVGATLPVLYLIPFFLGLSFLVTKSKRGLPDIAARTVVVNAAPAPPRIGRRSRRSGPARP